MVSKLAIVNPLFSHPVKGSCLLVQKPNGGGMKSYCISRLYDHQPSTDLKTYVMYYDEDG